jgi:hypothetical protein
MNRTNHIKDRLGLVEDLIDIAKEEHKPGLYDIVERNKLIIESLRGEDPNYIKYVLEYLARELEILSKLHF